MDRSEPFFEAVKKDMGVPLATAADDGVSMRLVSPVYHEGNVLMFTYADSKKRRQLKANPRCCIAAGGCFAECAAEFLGPTMLEDNRGLREVYSAKFADAFDEGVEFGGRDAEFILLKPKRITGWAFENDIPPADGVPTLPFEILLD